MSDTPEILYADGMGALTDALAGLERPGDYFAAGTLETAPPLLEVEGAGVVSMPVPPGQAEALAAAAGPAPYGRGGETLVDESVRKVRQIPPDKVKLGGKQWPPALEAILSRVTAGLGRPEGSLDVEFYKLLVYEPGGFFLAHRDTEKAPGMLGTLVVVLPSVHQGGELVVRHAGRETTLDLRGANPGELQYAAFYADCEHEVRPVTEGHRICLVYNLVAKAGKRAAAPAVPDDRPFIKAAGAALREWRERPGRAEKIVYLLEHRYTEAALSLHALKGPDAARAKVLRAAAECAGVVAHLGMVHIEESGWAEYNGDFWQPGRRGWSRWDDEDDEMDEDDEDDFEIGEVCDEHRFISQWRDAGDVPVDYGEIPLQDGEVLPAGALDDEEPDETHFSEATGNEGASFERTYLRAAIVLWAREDFDLICASAGQDAALTRLERRVEEARSGDGGAADAARKIVRSAIDGWPDYVWSEQRYARFLAALVKLGDLSLLREHALPLLPGAYTGAVNPALRLWAELAGPAAFAHVLEGLLEPRDSTGIRRPIAWMELWCDLAEIWNGRKDARGALDFLFQRILPNLRDDRFEEDPGGSFHHPSADEACSPELLARFLHHLESRPESRDLEAFLPLVCRNHERCFPPDDLILPALESIAEGARPVSAGTAGRLWRHCAEWLLARSANPPPAPKDWTLPLTEGQLKGLRPDIKDFALDPKMKEMRFRVRTDLRQEIHRIIDSRKLDMTHVTERRGRPYTLVCTKTLAHYDRACRRYQKDRSSMERLLRLPAARSPENAAAVEGLAAALEAGKFWNPTSPENLPAAQSDS